MRLAQLLVVALAAPLLCQAQSLLDDDGQTPLLTDHESGDGDVLVQRPNIVFVLTDDQDLHLNSLDYLPLIRKHLIEQGTLYRRHFCTSALCCPSRVSIWTGKAAHNTNVTDVNPPHGGYPKFVSQGLNENYLPLWLQAGGYNTYYTGKLFNAHTVENYDSPHVAGWNGSDFLLDPYTYSYLNSSYQRNHEPPVSYEGQHSVDVLTEKAYGFLDEAVGQDRPFFLGVAPVAPHSNVEFRTLVQGVAPTDNAVFSPPIPAVRHQHLFQDVKVPRTANFNPESPSGASWVRDLPRQSAENVEFNDHFYRSRLRALQAVDELVEGLVERLERYGVLDSTYIIYTTDNGYHIGQHRLQPGKECSLEEDINIPLIIRGPGVPANLTSSIVTTHTDLAPTVLNIAQIPAPESARLDGAKIPLTEAGLTRAAARDGRHEHVNVEYWGFAAGEGRLYLGNQRLYVNNTYKALRVIGGSWDLHYSVWCNGEHELYDLKTDPGQLHNLLLSESSPSPPFQIQGHLLSKVAARLDALLLVLKSCQGDTCIKPWLALHPSGDVRDLDDALSPRFDHFYEAEQARVAYSRCEMGYIRESEGPQFETDGQVFYYRDGLSWSEWV